MKTRQDIEALSRPRLVPYYLLSSILYYHMNRSPLTDDAFDFLCKRLQTEWKGVNHPHKKIINRADLDAGSCFLRIDQFPLIVRNAAEGFYSECTTSLVSPKRRITRAPIPVKTAPTRPSRFKRASSS